MIDKLIRKLDTEENRRYWAAIDQAAKHVEDLCFRIQKQQELQKALDVAKKFQQLEHRDPVDEAWDRINAQEQKSLYYEAHITLATTDEHIERRIKEANFHLSTVDGDGDNEALILTSREKDYTKLKQRMLSLMKNIPWTRYKVEAIVVDSKINEEWGARGN